MQGPGSQDPGPGSARFPFRPKPRRAGAGDASKYPFFGPFACLASRSTPARFRPTLRTINRRHASKLPPAAGVVLPPRTLPVGQWVSMGHEFVSFPGLVSTTTRGLLRIVPFRFFLSPHFAPLAAISLLKLEMAIWFLAVDMHFFRIVQFVYALCAQYNQL